MSLEELAETIFEAMNNERIERENFGRLDWEQVPTAHQDKYRRLAAGIIACWRQAPSVSEFEGVV
jgi:hypothetical protein